MAAVRSPQGSLRSNLGSPLEPMIMGRLLNFTSTWCHVYKIEIVVKIKYIKHSIRRPAFG